MSNEIHMRAEEHRRRDRSDRNAYFVIYGLCAAGLAILYVAGWVVGQ